MEKSFTMQASAHAFEVLSKSLYKNEKLAIIRELSSNAQDAHIAAGVEEPFDLHLPTSEEPFFDIRDYGTGISEDLIYDVYTSFFLSTKTDVEDQIGAFGLGSKTPFSLVDKYFVTSYCDDRKKVYKMEKVDGLPTVEKISDEPKSSHEKDGLEIRFDVPYTSYSCWSEWAEEARKFFMGTTFLPNINTFDDVDWDSFCERREFFTNDNIRFGNCYRPNLSVNVAGVRFYIDSNDFNTDVLKDAGVYEMNIVAGKSEVTITPSREALHFDNKTVQFLKNKIDSLLKEYFQKYWDNFDKITYTEALNLIQCQRYDNELNAKLEEKIGNLFFDKKLISNVSGRGTHLDTQPVLYNSSCRRNSNYILVNTSGIKTTVKQNVVNNFYNHQTFDDKGRLSSTAFAGVVKSMSSKDATFLFPKTAADFDKCKEFLGNGGTVKYWKDYCDLKKEASGRKLGFKTRQTLICKKTEDSNYASEQYFWGNNPDLEDDEVGLIYEEDTSYSQWYQIIKAVLPTFKLAIRPCKESVFKKQKEKGFQTVKEYALSLVELKKDEVLESIKTTKKKQALLKLFKYDFKANVFAAINNSKYDELENVPAFKTLREIYTEDTFKAKENTVWYYLPDGFLSLDDLPDYSVSFEKEFPLAASISYVGEHNIEPFLDYLLLYYSNGNYEENLKKNEVAA